MPAKNETIKFALEFPQGYVLFMEGDVYRASRDEVGGIYFYPHNSPNAFMVWGERKELFGKHAVSVAQDRETGAGGYSVVYEFSNGALADARLVKGDQTIGGRLVAAAEQEKLNEAVQNGAITLRGRQDTEAPKVHNVACFEDGRYLIQLLNKAELYLGTPGNYTKLDATLTVQGGGSRFYTLPGGEEVNLPYGYGGPAAKDMPTFNGEKLIYLKMSAGADPATFGLTITSDVPYVDPFTMPQVPAAPRPAAKIKPPGF